MIAIEEIRAARARTAESLLETPCLHSPALSECFGGRVYLKCENLQRTGAFKARGALNRILQLEGARESGVIAASAGNHAQGVAFAASQIGAPSLIVMPDATPLVKVTRTRSLGAEVRLFGTTFDEAYAHALEIAEETGMTFVHPFDDDQIMAGQGVIGLEILEQVPDVDIVVTSIGGGGLLGGIASALRGAAERPIAIYGVQTEAAPSMHNSLDAGRRSEYPVRSTLAEGIAVRMPGQRTFDVLSEAIDEVTLASEEEIERAIYQHLNTNKMLVEGAGAAPLAALTRQRESWDLAGKNIVLVVSGGNIDVATLNRIIERSLVREARVVQLQIELRDRPGALAALLEKVAENGANVVRVRHNRSIAGARFWTALVQLTLETRNEEHVGEILQSLQESGYERVRRLDVERLPI